VGVGRLTERLARWADSRAKALAAGVALLAVPTAFGVFPGWTEWPAFWRGVILVVWLLVAAATVAGATLRDETIHDLTADRKALLKSLRLLGTREVLDALLRPGTRGIPESYEFTLYLYDEAVDKLVAYYPLPMPRLDPDPRTFEPGCGATGLSWETQQIVVVRGDDVSNAAYGLTPDQQTFFRGYRAVASAVVWEEHTTPIGVITALSREDDGYFSEAGGRDTLTVLADVLGVVLNRIPEDDDLG
jgi:hypothetical protein